MASLHTNTVFEFGVPSQQNVNIPSFNVFGQNQQNQQAPLFPSQNTASQFNPQNTNSHTASWSTPVQKSPWTTPQKSPWTTPVQNVPWTTPVQNVPWTTPVQNVSWPTPVTQNDKGHLAQCLNESKNIQIEILKELKILNEKKNEQNTQKIIHNSVSCNGCMKPHIHGLRYKCVFCKDFDLCEECEVSTTHSENHSFIKIKDTEKFNNMTKISQLFNNSPI
jgi:hypothetical protein